MATNGDHQAMNLTKREMFALVAMQAIVGKTPVGYDPNSWKYCATARGAVGYADALIAELSKAPA